MLFLFLLQLIKLTSNSKLKKLKKSFYSTFIAALIYIFTLSTKNDTLTEEQVSEQNKLDITKPKTTPILTSTAFSGYL